MYSSFISFLFQLQPRRRAGCVCVWRDAVSSFLFFFRKARKWEKEKTKEKRNKRPRYSRESDSHPIQSCIYHIPNAVFASALNTKTVKGEEKEWFVRAKPQRRYELWRCRAPYACSY
jgi:hypothetical protein